MFQSDKETCFWLTCHSHGGDGLKDSAKACGMQAAKMIG